MKKKKETTQTMREHRELLFVLPFNAQHIGDREEQQDYFSYSDLLDPAEVNRSGNAAVLADGMGGLENGYSAAFSGVNTFLNTYLALAADTPELLDAAMQEALFSANADVCRFPGSGATLAAVVIKQNYLHWISVGDSRIYLVRKGAARQLNEDHIYASELDEMVQQGAITYEQAQVHPERGALISYLGMPNITLFSQNQGEFPLLMHDVILLCSDGMYRALSPGEIAAIVDGARENIAQDLVNAVLDKHIDKQDNITVLALKTI